MHPNGLQLKVLVAYFFQLLVGVSVPRSLVLVTQGFIGYLLAIPVAVRIMFIFTMLAFI